MSILSHEVSIIELPKIVDNRGNLSFIEKGPQLPFDIDRVYWIYDVPGGEKRGGHAFKTQYELIVAMSGSFDVVTQDGDRTQRFTLNRSYYGLYIPKMIWRHMENFSTNSLALILANTSYAEEDYVRDYDEYLQLIHQK
jgi:dTDP-4-dehydrorhamnose 3,5-epimerase-like enzyme